MSFLYSIFGFLLRALYQWVGNYGLALILLTLFARILMLPMSIKQQKSTAKMQRLQSKVRKIQQQYAGDHSYFIGISCFGNLFGKGPSIVHGMPTFSSSSRKRLMYLSVFKSCIKPT